MDGHSARVDSRNARWRHNDKTLLCLGYKLPQEGGFARAGLAREKDTRARVLYKIPRIVQFLIFFFHAYAALKMKRNALIKLYKVKGFISEIVNFAAVWSRVTTFSPPLY